MAAAQSGSSIVTREPLLSTAPHSLTGYAHPCGRVMRGGGGTGSPPVSRCGGLTIKPLASRRTAVSSSCLNICCMFVSIDVPSISINVPSISINVAVVIVIVVVVVVVVVVVAAITAARAVTTAATAASAAVVVGVVFATISIGSTDGGGGVRYGKCVGGVRYSFEMLNPRRLAPLPLTAPQAGRV